MQFIKKPFFVLIVLAISAFGTTFPDSYYKITSNSVMKTRFIAIMLPVIQKENAKILKEREFLENTLNKNIFLINSTNIRQLLAIKRKYKIARVYDLHSYLKKVDIVPPSLALAQASIESGWGKSRFVREANNIFGQWTYSGVGIIPEERIEGATHRIRVFRDLEDSVANYMLNLNMGWAYNDFRRKRYELRMSGKELDGYTLATTLLKYSSTGQVYVDKVQSLINDNNLWKYD
ncbi:MAG: glucosaminidase domain-containing protein [Arcobacteraceae bacterium]|nr:glucosaminidase domain-containing protein [Arcobacteraceae bacterium]MDY0327183.1 glucosaminidase domain-containing protein [Arcobacteraceae bacterium]